MTDLQAAQIRDMRLEGMGYRAIADALGLSRDIVRNRCKAKGMAGYGTEAARNLQGRDGICLCCGKEATQKRMGRPRKFCSEKCRRQWWKAHPEEMDRRSAGTHLCACCGREFRAYGDRKYCSHGCYTSDRFGRCADGKR